MIDEIQKQIDEYVDWLRKGISLRKVADDWAEITTPFLDRHNDHIQIFVRKDGDSYFLTDDGYIISDLEQSGCSFSTQKRKLLLAMALNGFGIEQSGNSLLVNSTKKDFPRRIHNLVQGMLAVNDLFATARTTVASLFYEDVVSWLDDSEIRYTPNVRIMGRSHYEHSFDFVIPHTKKSPERFVQTMNSPSRESAQRLVFAWVDVRDIRPGETAAYAMLNDKEAVPKEVVEALRAYQISPILWTEREQAKQSLAA